MKVKVEKGGPCRKTLVVELPAEDVSAEHQKVLDEFARFARIPGFRKGKAPVALVASHFSKDIREEIKERLVGRSYPEAVKQSGLRPLMVLDLQAEIEPGKPFVYRVTLDIPPEFKLPRYKRIPVSQRPVAISDEDVNKALAGIIDRLSTTEPVSDRPAQKGDLAQVDYERSAPIVEQDSHAGNDRDPLKSGHGAWIEVGGRESFPPGFAGALEGLAIGETREIKTTLPPDFPRKEMAGREMVFKVRLAALREKKPPAMDAAFFKSAGVNSETELRAMIREQLQNSAETREKERRKEEIVEYLLAHASFELPESIVREETSHMFASIVRERVMRGSTREQIASQRDELLSAATKTAAEKVKLGYILHRIGEEEHIAVADGEVSAEIRAMAARYRMPPEELERELREKNELDSVRNELRMNKIMDFILADSIPEEKGIMARLFGKKEEAKKAEPGG